MTLKFLKEEEYEKIKNIIIEEYKDNILKQKSNYVNFQSYSNKMVGIFLKDSLIGIIKTASFMGEISLEIYICPEYRGHSYATFATQLFIEEFGYLFKDKKKFLINIDPHNTSSLKVAEKLGWHQTFIYDDDLMNEGAEYFYVFEHLNPYYEKTFER